MTTPEARYARLRTTAVGIWAVIGGLLLAAVAFWALGKISSALVPFVMAFIMVFLLNWPVRVLAEKGVPRGIATLLCFLLGALVLGAVLTLLVPPVTRQVVSLARSAPEAVARIEGVIAGLQTRFDQLILPDWGTTLLSNVSGQLSNSAVGAGNVAAGALVTAGGGVLTAFFDVVLALVVAYWALRDLPKLREEIIVLAGPKYQDDAELLISTVTRVAGGYLKGQTIASLCTGTLAWIGLSILNVPYALVIGLITAVFNYVPYVGPFAAGLIAAVVGLFVGPWTALFAIAVIIAAQNLTDTLVTPRVMSEQVDLHPILVIFSLLVGGSLFGIAGMLFAIPVAATGKGLFVYYYERKTKRQLSTEDGALFRGAGGDSDNAPDADHEAPDGMCV